MSMNGGSDTLSAIDVLNRKIDFFLNSFHKIRDENEELKKRFSSVDDDLKAKDSEIKRLNEELDKKEVELSEIVEKLEKILS